MMVTIRLKGLVPMALTFMLINSQWYEAATFLRVSGLEGK